MRDKPTVSVIMRSNNDDWIIGETLSVLFSQTIRDFEFINIDNASEDRTLEIVRKYPGKQCAVGVGKYVPGKVLNDMVALAKGEIIVFLNSNATPTECR